MTFPSLLPGQVLIDDQIGHRVALRPGQSLTLGRAAEFPLGPDDEFMHRRFLQIWDSDGTWMITNCGKRLTANIQPRAHNSFSQSRLGPGASLPLPLGESAVVFATSVTTYELDLTVAATLKPPAGTAATGPAAGAPLTVGELIFNEEQVNLLRALAEPLVRRPGTDLSEVPTVKDLEQTLGWSQKKVNTKIDYLSKALEGSGVTGFSARNGNAPTRRLALARYAQENYWSLRRQG
ncbi:hypothetical protein ACT3SZ_08505 [Corynebacterium sp. AOP40-9SA-29]|uniref:hypothetical protein n=1 Tax=Corynebacterium sp. AOP40-9SA-29 TaxID=3457677 RepID=UPI004033CB9D